MAVKKTQMYRRNLDGTETGLNPLTESQYVLMENGQTVQEVLSDRDSDKYTPVITNSSSTFKVGQGNNVDLSSSMKEGAYDSCVLKGKTMVNCIQEPSSQDVVLPYAFADGQYVTINDTKESGALGVELKGQTLVNVHGKKAYSLSQSGETIEANKFTNIVKGENQVSFDMMDGLTYGWGSFVNGGSLNLDMLKPNTKYLAYFGTAIFPEYFGVSFRNGDGTNLISTQAQINKGGNYAIITTTNEIVKSSQILYISIPQQHAGHYGFKDIMVIEYQEGMENWDIPHFEGMTSCKMPILSTVGKNLFDSTQLPTYTVQDAVIGFGGVFKSLSNGVYTTANYGAIGWDVELEEGQIYTLSLKGRYLIDKNTNSSGFMCTIGINNKLKDNRVYGEARIISHSYTFVATKTTKIGIGIVAYGVDGTDCEIYDIQLEKTSSATSYEPYKSSILSLPEEVVLRGLPNGVCDTFNTRTGVYTQRIWSKTFNGTESYTGWGSSSVAEGMTGIHTRTKVNDKIVTTENQDGQILCDTLPTIHRNQLSSCQYNSVVKGNNYIGFTMKGKTSDEIKQWLSENPTTVYCELKTPVVTKINLPSTLKSWNTTTHIYSEIPENTLYPTLSHSNPSYPVILKPSTKYSIVTNSYSNSHTNSAIKFNLGGATASTTVGNRVTTITTPSTLSNELLTMSGRGNKLNNVMVIEGDVVGDEPYFEGICDCKSPILSNCGKNLFDYNLLDKQPYTKNGLTFAVVGDTLTIKGTATSGGYMSLFDYTLFNTWGSGVYANTDKYIELGEGTYCISTHGKITKPEVRLANVFGQGTKLIGHIHPKDQTTFTVSNNERFGLCLVFGFSNGATYDEEIKIQLEKTSSNTFTTYEPYKSNTTTFEQKDGKTIVLRSLPNGVCDTLNVETGEYVQRIGDVVLNGNEEWSYLETNNTFRTNIVADKAVQQNDTTLIYIISDKYTSKSYAVSWNEGKFISLHTNKQIVFRDENFTTSVAFKQWLSQNPVTVQYELATPIITTVDVQGFPYAYTNGHVQLSSGHNGQSLTPKVEFSLSANKTGQIQSNTKRVSAHQKQLDDFEAMMLTSMVQSAYDKAILQFDYEMQMMSLGGE